MKADIGSASTDRNIALLGGFFLLTFAIMGLALAYWTILRGRDLGTSQSNPRVVSAEAETIRGTITAADGTVLARTDPTTHDRHYMLPSLSNVIGYSSPQYGQADLEQTFDNYLAGRSTGNPIGEIRRQLLHEPQIGNNLQLSIVPRVQQVADTALGNRRGAVVVLRPTDGAVLAMVSKPYFDANQLTAQWSSLSQDSGRPLFNRASQAVYPPGSTFKLVTNAAALETGIAKPDSMYTCINEWVIEGFHISCENPQIPTTFNLLTALERSSNATYGRLAVQLGAERFQTFAGQFGFGTRIPVDLPSTVSRVRQSEGPWSNALLASSGFGQGEIQASPLQMAMVVDALANNGQMVEPYLVRSVTAPDGRLLYDRHTQPWRTAISSQTANVSKQMMQSVVEKGSGSAARIPGVTVGGKTGTAQVGGTALPHAWFVCFAPVDSPQAIVVVIAENSGEGADVAAPIARIVLQAALATPEKP